MVNAQEWLDKEYPIETRNQIKVLNISKKDLEGNLKLANFSSLEELYCPDNLLTDVDLSELDAEKLKIIDLSDNDFLDRDLAYFSSFINLEIITIENNKKNGKINRFFGSLEPLRNLRNLKKVIINNTNVSLGLEYLPESVEDIFSGCDFLSTHSFEGLECKKIYEQLEDYLRNTWINYDESHPVYKALEALDETGYITKRINLEAWRIENNPIYREKVKGLMVQENLFLQNQANKLKKQMIVSENFEGEIGLWEKQLNELEGVFERQVKHLKEDFKNQLKDRRKSLTNALHHQGSSKSIHQVIDKLKEKLKKYDELVSELKKTREMLDGVNLEKQEWLTRIEKDLSNHLQKIQKIDNRKIWKGYYETMEEAKREHREDKDRFQWVQKERRDQLKKIIGSIKNLTQKLLNNQIVETKIEHSV